MYFNRKLRGSLGPALNREIGLRAWLVQAGNAKLRVRARCRVFLPILASAVGSSASPRGLMAELRKWCARWFEDKICSFFFFVTELQGMRFVPGMKRFMETPACFVLQCRPDLGGEKKIN